jgi:endonuclease/exonuclease/phosphatase family metal-dependent hydrolase
MTYNTAIGNPAIKTPQAAFLQLPFYQRVITGAADAPIMGLQEVGDDQHEALKKLSKNGNFKMYVQGVGLRGRQNNMLVVPKRFQVLKFEDKIYKIEHLKAAIGQVKDYLKGKFDKEPDAEYNWSQISEPRGYQRARLKDTVTGKVFTVFNTHVSYYDPIRPAHVKQLMAAANDAAKDGPVLVLGDLNTRTLENDAAGRDTHVRTFFAGYTDLGPVGIPTKKSNIDYVLGKGIVGVSARWYLGTDIALPGSPDALTVSDHYAEEDVVAFQ